MKKHKPYNKFKGYLVEKGLTYSDIATLLNLTIGTVSQKINGISDFYLSEIEKMCNKYEINVDFFLD